MVLCCGCSFNSYRSPEGAKFTRWSFGQETHVQGFELTTNGVKVNLGSNKGQPEIVEAVVRGAVSAIIAKP